MISDNGNGKILLHIIPTALQAGGRSDADIATPTKDPALPPSTDIATPAPDGSAIITPTHKLLNIPLKMYLKDFSDFVL